MWTHCVIWAGPGSFAVLYMFWLSSYKFSVYMCNTRLCILKAPIMTRLLHGNHTNNEYLVQIGVISMKGYDESWCWVSYKLFANDHTSKGTTGCVLCRITLSLYSITMASQIVFFIESHSVYIQSLWHGPPGLHDGHPHSKSMLEWQYTLIQWDILYHSIVSVVTVI